MYKGWARRRVRADALCDQAADRRCPAAYALRLGVGRPPHVEDQIGLIIAHRPLCGGFAQKVPSFRDAAEGREPGIHEHPPLEYGFRVRRRAPPRNDEFLCKALWEMLPLLFLWQIPMIRGLGFWFPNPLIWIGSPGRTRTSDQAVNSRSL